VLGQGEPAQTPRVNPGYIYIYIYIYVYIYIYTYIHISCILDSRAGRGIPKMDDEDRQPTKTVLRTEYRRGIQQGMAIIQERDTGGGGLTIPETNYYRGLRVRGAPLTLTLSPNP